MPPGSETQNLAGEWTVLICAGTRGSWQSLDPFRKPAAASVYLVHPLCCAGCAARTVLVCDSRLGLTALPWTLKLVNGFIMDRYTFLAMGRRRIWIIGAQGVRRNVPGRAG